MPRNSVCKALAAMAAALAALSACDENTVYNSYRPVGVWERTDTVKFAVPQAKAEGTYTTEVGLRINAQYPFTGICIIVDRRIMPGDIRHSDTLNCKLIDKRGNALGHGLSNYQYLFATSQCRLKKGDSLFVNVRHHMKRETLPGLEDIGIKVTRR